MAKRTWFEPGTYYAKNRERVLAAAKQRHRLAMADKPERCDLCETPDARLVRDHDHATGAARGWICYSCNMLLGRLERRDGWVERATRYLEVFATYQTL